VSRRGFPAVSSTVSARAHRDEDAHAVGAGHWKAGRVAGGERGRPDGQSDEAEEGDGTSDVGAGSHTLGNAGAGAACTYDAVVRVILVVARILAGSTGSMPASYSMMNP
jgi:hypothetical protein